MDRPARVVAGEEQDMKDGGPAFPVPAELCQDLTVHEQRGMTLRDYFAAKAMQGFCSNPNASNHPAAVANWLRDHGAVSAYQMADAMIQERSKT
jgi:hypothetical protein